MVSSTPTRFPPIQTKTLFADKLNVSWICNKVSLEPMSELLNQQKLSFLMVTLSETYLKLKKIINAWIQDKILEVLKTIRFCWSFKLLKIWISCLKATHLDWNMASLPPSWLACTKIISIGKMERFNFGGTLVQFGPGVSSDGLLRGCLGSDVDSGGAGCEPSNRRWWRCLG